ncbi:DUF2931 family protein [Enterobacter cloacae complex sp. 2022EL-00788]|uniref:DUF2931 family protein n=1 Tax=Enterobacter cloacae complex sp. 2022EL-00788 TaxID=2996512 RepID=UPI002270C016|nr:DUF2931 family protein [Enterobacter cloacae complex sp. 2022EL-00788]MCY0773746.1 DUF2931 family protein [Enterobacter cloacae complex sp. 2022EL-00788]
MTIVKLIFTALLLVSVTGCTAEKTSSLAPGETEWGYKKLPYDEWKFLFIYPKALPALATQALMVDGAGYKTTYEYIDTTRPSQVSVGRWNDHLGVTQSYYNKGKALPLMLRFCWDSVIDKKSYETLILFKKGTWEQMTTLYTDSYRPDETYYRDTMVIGLAPGGKVSVWLDNLGDPVVPQSDAKITTVSGDKMQMCKGVTKSDFSYGYDQDIKEFIKGKTYPYGNW